MIINGNTDFLNTFAKKNASVAKKNGESTWYKVDFITIPTVNSVLLPSITIPPIIIAINVLANMINTIVSNTVIYLENKTVIRFLGRINNCLIVPFETHQ